MAVVVVVVVLELGTFRTPKQGSMNAGFGLAEKPGRLACYRGSASQRQPLHINPPLQPSATVTSPNSLRPAPPPPEPRYGQMCATSCSLAEVPGDPTPPTQARSESAAVKGP